MEDLESVLGDSPSEETPAAQAQEQTEQESTESEAKEETQEPEAKAEPPEPKEEEPSVPLSVFKSMRDDYKQKLDQVSQQANRPQQEPPKAPDMFENPEAYQKYVGEQIGNARTQTKLEMSRFMAERDFGAEEVQAVVDYFNDKPQLTQQFLNAPSPFHAAKQYVDAQKTAQEIGNDPAAYKARIEKEVRAQIEAEMVAKQAQEMAAKSAPSLANTNGSGGKTDPGWSGPTDLTSLIGE